MALEALDGLAAALQAPSKLRAVGNMAAGMIRGHIHEGKGFAPLAPATEEYRGAGRPLQDTGSLRDSIASNVVDEKTVSVGTNKPYAAIQNNGGVIRAKKEWLWIPASGVRQMQRRFGYSPTDVIKGLKAAGYSVFRMGRTMCYRSKRKEGGAYKVHTLYYLKKSVEVPARRFFYLSGQEIGQLAKEAGIDLEQL